MLPASPPSCWVERDICDQTLLPTILGHFNPYIRWVDFNIDDGIAGIPIEQRAPEEVVTITGKAADGRIVTVQLVPDGSQVGNYAFDVTPARLVTGLITERGVIGANRAALAAAFPERAAEVLGLRPEVSLEEGLRRTVEHFRSRAAAAGLSSDS